MQRVVVLFSNLDDMKTLAAPLTPPDQCFDASPFLKNKNNVVVVVGENAFAAIARYRINIAVVAFSFASL